MASKPSTPVKTENSGPGFEESLERLEQIVQQLEQGRLGLSESLARYEEGVKHLKQCYLALETAERKIQLLAGVDADGNPIAEDFDDADLSLDEKAAARSQRRSRPASRASGGENDAAGKLF